MRDRLRLLGLGAIAALLFASDALARAFVLPHVLEKSGRITNTQFTFDTAIFMEYTGGLAGCPAGQACAFVQLYLFDQTTGNLLEAAGGQDVCPPCLFMLGSGDEGSQPGPRKRNIVLDQEILASGGFANANVVLGSAIAVVNGDFDNVNITSAVTNAKSGPLDLAVFGFEPQPILPLAPFQLGAALAPLGAAEPPLGPSRTLDDIREDQGTVETTNGAYDTSLSIFYFDAWFGAGAPPTGVDVDFFDEGGSPMLDAAGMPYSITIADLSQLPQPVIVDLETPLFGGVAPGSRGKRGYAEVSLTGALPERVDVTSFVRKAVTGPSDLDPDGFYEQALSVPEPGDAALTAALGALAVLARSRTSNASSRC